MTGSTVACSWTLPKNLFYTGGALLAYRAKCLTKSNCSVLSVCSIPLTHTHFVSKAGKHLHEKQLYSRRNSEKQRQHHMVSYFFSVRIAKCAVCFCMTVCVCIMCRRSALEVGDLQGTLMWFAPILLSSVSTSSFSCSSLSCGSFSFCSSFDLFDLKLS